VRPRAAEQPPLQGRVASRRAHAQSGTAVLLPLPRFSFLLVAGVAPFDGKSLPSAPPE